MALLYKSVRCSPALMPLSARRCHLSRFGEDRSKATFGSHEWFTVLNWFSLARALLMAVKVVELTIYKIGVQLDVIVLPGAALNRCVRLWARSRTRDRCDDGTSREVLQIGTAEWRCECVLSPLDSPSEPPDPNQAHRPYRTEPRRCRGVRAYILELAASCLRASLPPASSSSLSYVLDSQLFNVILYGHDIL